MIVLVTGSRHYSDMRAVRAALNGAWDRYQESGDESGFRVVHGGAKGADSLAHYWVNAMNAPRVGGQVVYERPMQSIYHADWEKYGSRAGTLRNTKMRDEIIEYTKVRPQPIEVHAFPLKGSIGTWHMVKLATNQGWDVTIHNENLVAGPPDSINDHG